MENLEYNFKEKWSLNTPIEWQKEGRKELNKIIEIYNNWQVNDQFDKAKAQIVLGYIEYGLQTIGSKDGGSSYAEELEDMKEFIETIIN